MFKFLEMYQYIIDQVVDPATKSSLQKAHTILTAIDTLKPLHEMLMEWQAAQPAQEVILAELNKSMDLYRAELERLGWTYCPDTTPPNFNGERGWMHPFYAQRGHRHILYISNDINDVAYLDVTIYFDTEMKYHENTSVGALMDWMDGALGENHADHI